MKWFFVSWVGIFLFTSPVWAESPQTLSLNQAMSIAIANNPQLQAAQKKAGVSEAEILTAGARFNPSLLSDNGIAEKTYRLGIEQTIELGGKRRRRIALSQAQRDVVLAEIETALLDLRANVRRAYTTLFSLQERLYVNQDIATTAEQLLEVTRKRERAGDVANLDVLQAEIVAVNVRNDLQTIAWRAMEARNSLNALLNQPLSTVITLNPPEDFLAQSSPQLPAQSKTGLFQAGVTEGYVDLDTLIQLAFKRRPERQLNSRKIVVTERQLALARANRIPNLRLAGGYDRVSGTEGGHGVFVIGNLDLPLLNRQQGPMREAEARRIQLEAEGMALSNQITLEVSNAHTAWRASQERVLRYETELLPKAQTVVEKSRRSFEEGKSGILTPITAQQAFINTRMGYLQALLDNQNAISDLERAIGAGL